MDERQLTQAEKLLQPYHDEIVKLMGSEYQGHPAYQKLAHDVAVLGRSPRVALEDVQYIKP